ncbi:MAG TPA: multidrug effflux MFS transporter [Taishania sp.]|nr:multidrug effflux MFS transporter [Taishania sp.]
MQKKSVNRTFLILLLGILAAIGPFTIDMYLPGFQQIATAFQVEEQQVAFTLTSYFFGIAVGQLIYGPIVDKYGRKKPLLVGLSIYIIASLGCAIAFNLESLIAMRLLQALGACVGMVASNAIISDVYEVEKRAKAFSLIMLVMGVAPLIAPSLGSIFIINYGWATIFYFLALFSFLVFMLIYFFLPETSEHMHSHKLRGKKIALGYYFILRNKVFLNYTLASSLSMSILFGYISSASFIFLTYFGLSKETFSLVFAINASGLISGSYVNGLLTSRFHFIKIAKVAVIVLLAVSGCVLFIVSTTPTLPYQWVVASLFSILFLLGFINPNTTAASFAPFSGNAGAASALGGAIRMGVGAITASIVGVLQSDSLVTVFVIILALAVAVVVLTFKAPSIESKLKDTHN